MTSAIAKFFSQGRISNHLESDNTTEFYDSKVKELKKKYNVKHYSTFSSLKASVCKRFNLTLRIVRWPEFHYQRSHNWIKL